MISETAITRVLAIICLSLLSVSVAAQSDGRKKISLSDGYKLANTALTISPYANLPGLHLEEDGEPSDHFYFLMGIWDNPAPGSVTAGGFAIQRETGDVWDMVLCEEIKAPVLARAQNLLREELGLTAASYKALRKKPPGCERI